MTCTNIGNTQALTGINHNTNTNNSLRYTSIVSTTESTYTTSNTSASHASKTQEPKAEPQLSHYKRTHKGHLQHGIMVVEWSLSCNNTSTLYNYYMHNITTNLSYTPTMSYITLLRYSFSHIRKSIPHHFLKLASVCIKCSVLYANIPFDEDHVVCISRLWTIVDRQARFKFLIPVSDNF